MANHSNNPSSPSDKPAEGSHPRESSDARAGENDKKGSGNNKKGGNDKTPAATPTLSRRAWLYLALFTVCVSAGAALIYINWPTLTQKPITNKSQHSLSGTPSVQKLHARLNAIEQSMHAFLENPSYQNLESRMHSIETTLMGLAQAKNANALIQAGMWLSEAKKQLEGNGDRRFAISAIRTAQTLIKQAKIKRLDPAVTKLSGLVGRLTSSPKQVRDALQQIADILVALDKNDASPQQPQSFWGRMAHTVNQAMPGIVKIQNENQTLVASLEFIVVRRTLAIARNALLDQDYATWSLAINHAQDIANQLENKSLSAKIGRLKEIKNSYDNNAIVRTLNTIITTLQKVGDAN